MHADKQKNILSLSPQERYGYFIRTVADWEQVWLIYVGEGVVTLGGNDGSKVIPVWPEKEFAELMLTDGWEHGSVESVDVYTFIELLGDWEKEGCSIAGFPSVELNSVTVGAEEMKNHLLYELDQYE